MSAAQPPRWLERILERALPAGLSGQGTLGDLAEEYARRARRSRLRARVWYLGQAASLLRSGTFTRERSGPRLARMDLFLDLRWSLRSLVKNPLFSCAVVVVLGLGLGANAAVFSVVDGTFRNTSWWRQAEATVTVWPGRSFSRGELDLYARHQSVYRVLGGTSELAFALRLPDGESASVNGVLLSPALFRELAQQPALGRALADDDAVPGSERVVILGEALWRRSFDADPGILGSSVEVNGTPHTVVGIQPAGARAPGGRAELWLPLVLDPRDEDFWPARELAVIGVLRQGADLDDAFADLGAHTENLSQLFPRFYPKGFARGAATVVRADEAQRRLVATPLLLLLGGTGLLMLVTALNVGNLLLGRAIGRRTELALRTALGAGRGRIVVQLLVEGGVWAVLALGLALAAGSVLAQTIAGLFVGESVVTSSRMLSVPVLVYTGALGTLAWWILSGVPIAHYLRSQRTALTVKPSSAARTQRTLVTVQAALATLLLVSATLLVATVDNLRRVPLGFDPAGLLTVELSPPEDRVATVPRARDLYDGLVEKVAAIPGVESAGSTAWLPLRAEAPPVPINLEAAPIDPAQAVTAPRHLVDPGFFETLGVKSREGRLLGMEDRDWQPSAAVVNESLAATLWPDVSPVGQRIAIDPHAWWSWVEVVGVVPDLRSGTLTGPPQPALYVPLAESPSRDLTLIVRAPGRTASLVPEIRRAIAEVDPLVPIRAITPMDEVVRAAYSTAWVMMGLLVVLAVLASGLGAVGVYAVLAHWVALNRTEIGIRMALGARPGRVVRTVVRSGLLLTGAGVLLGSAGALGATRFLESLLFGVSALAPWAFLAPALALLAAAALAGLVPALRAASLPPCEVLRSE